MTTTETVVLVQLFFPLKHGKSAGDVASFLLGQGIKEDRDIICMRSSLHPHHHIKKECKKKILHHIYILKNK
jgi:hypothetical protein